VRSRRGGSPTRTYDSAPIRNPLRAPRGAAVTHAAAGGSPSRSYASARLFRTRRQRAGDDDGVDRAGRVFRTARRLCIGGGRTPFHPPVVRSFPRRCDLGRHLARHLLSMRVLGGPVLDWWPGDVGWQRPALAREAELTLEFLRRCGSTPAAAASDGVGPFASVLEAR
jgi:hypothetical protein